VNLQGDCKKMFKKNFSITLLALLNAIKAGLFKFAVKSSTEILGRIYLMSLSLYLCISACDHNIVRQFSVPIITLLR